MKVKGYIPLDEKPGGILLTFHSSDHCKAKKEKNMCVYGHIKKNSRVGRQNQK
jgi:hypothetical protein